MDKGYQIALKRIKEVKEKKLTTLDLSNLELTECPKEVFELIHLTKLNICRNKLTKIPESIGGLTNLIELNLERNQLNILPESTGKLINLIDLSLANNQITKFPKFIEKLINLTILSIHNNQLVQLPESIGKLTSLTKLYLYENQLVQLPESIGILTNIIELNLNSNQLTTLPKSIKKLTNLRILAITRNKLTSLPKSLNNLTNISLLAIGNNQLTIVPEFIKELFNLRELYLWGNKFSEVPEFIGYLKKLEILDIAQLQMTELPESIGNLVNLEELHLTSNQLSSLPESIKNLTNLKFLDLHGNQFQVGEEVYKLSPQEQIQHILNWQRAQEAGTLQPIHEAKVIFIGESNYGKTHLIEFLKNGKINRTINTTHGIERSQLNIPYQEKDIRLNIWDLGGQEFMRSTHQFFFSERTLYVLVSLARRERNELNHWLKLANQLGNKAPVLIVINKVDEDGHDLDRNSLQRDYPNIIGFVRTSINNCQEGKAKDTLNALKSKISDIVSNQTIMPGVFEQRSPEWFQIKETLEKLEEQGTDFITYDEYEQLDFIKDLPEEERKSNLKLLSMLGAVVSFVDDPRLINTNVINPQWIMDGVYAIINDAEVKDTNKGKLDIKDLARILPKRKFPKSRHIYLLELMQKFNLCYVTRDQPDIYFIPDLFEDVEPDYEWNSEVSMHFRYDYDDFSPDAFMTRFIVEMHQDIIEDKRWRSGVYISNGACSAKVYQSYRKNYIHIEIHGHKEEARSYLYAIRETFRKLHKPFPQIDIKQEVLYKEHWINYLQLIRFEEKNRPLYHMDLDEDLPITNILNGYSTPTDRQGQQKHIKIFLASSFELKEERDQFEIFIHRENQRLYKNGIFMELVVWENFIDAMSQTRLQDEYNNAIKHCDIFVSLFFTKVGKFTLEEFETAFGQFKNTGKPLVYTYFKDANIKSQGLNKKDILSRFDFEEKLIELGHFKTVFEDMKDLKFQFRNQLDKILPNL